MTEDKDRLRHLLTIADKEAKYLQSTFNRLSSETINEKWVVELEDNLELAERVDAFIVRFGRLLDHLVDKLTPALLTEMLEEAGSAIDNLDKMEKLGLISSVDEWAEASNLRDRLSHERVEDTKEFASSLNRSMELVRVLSAAQIAYDICARRFV